MSRYDQLSSTQSNVYVHVMVVNFSHEKIELSMATILGVEKETSARIIAAINDKENLNSKHSKDIRCGVNTVVDDAKTKQYLQDKLGHLSHAERSVMEPVLVKYKHVFQNEWSNDFQVTDLVEH